MGPVGELTPGMRLQLSTVSEVHDPHVEGIASEDEAALVGWLHGDGPKLAVACSIASPASSFQRFARRQ